MSAAAVSLITSLAPEVINLIAGLVHKQAPVAEATYGPSTGLVKFADVFSFVITALQTAAAAGQIPKVLPSDDTVKAIIQAVVQSMQLSGLLGAETTTSAASSSSSVVKPAQPQALKLTPGQVITISA